MFRAARAGNVERMKVLIAAKADLDQAEINGYTPIYIAAQKGKTKCMKLLLGAKAGVDKAAHDGSTPIYVAAGHGQTECMKLLLGAKANVDKAADDGSTPICFAAGHGQTACMKLLLGAKANVDKAADDGGTPIYVAAGLGQTECMKLLLGAKANVDQATDDGGTPICVAAYEGQTACMKLLLGAKADADKATDKGWTPIHLAAQERQTECVKLLVRAKANVDKVADDAGTPIYLAAGLGQTECMKLLLGAKADADKAADDGSTPICFAAGHGQTECMKLLLGAKANVDKAADDGSTPIYVAAGHGQTECMKLLLGAKANVDKAADDGSTPICFAAGRGQTACMKLLIGAKADVDKAADNGCTPIYVAAQEGQKECMKLLLGAKADVDKAADNGCTPIHLAAQKGQTECMKLLVRAKADVEKAAHDGSTPIYVATQEGQTECVKLLLGAKANVDKAADDGSTPICSAAGRGQTACMKLLLGAKANVDKAKDNGLWSPIHVAAQEGQTGCLKLLVGAKANVDKATDNGYTPIYIAAQHGQTECMKLLIGAKADADNAADNGCTPIYVAAQEGQRECMKLLLGAKADVDKAADDGWTPIYMAAQHGQTECLKLLVGAKADVDNAADNGCTPIHIAAHNGEPECMKLLVGAKADVDTKYTRDGFTPLHSAVKSGNIEILKLLIDAKAYVHIPNHSNITPCAYAKTLGQDEMCNALLRAEKEFDTIEALLMEPGKVGAVIESIAALISEKRSLHGKQHKNKRKKLGTKLKKLTDQMKRFEHVMRLHCSGSDLETWQSFLKQARDSSVAKYQAKRQTQDESAKKQNGAIKQRSENVIGLVKLGNGTDSETLNIVDEATTAEMTKQHDAAKMAIQPQLFVLRTAIHEDESACSKVIHEAHVAAEQNAVMKATFIEQKRVSEEKALEESRAAAHKAAEAARVAVRIAADAALARQKKIDELEKWLRECKCSSFVKLLVHHSVITVKDVKQQLSGLAMSTLLERVRSGCDERVSSEEEEWNFAVAVQSLVPASSMCFTESEMQVWEEPQVDRWLKQIGFPHSLDIIGENLVEARQGSLKFVLKKLIRKKRLQSSWETLEEQILKARDEALGRSRSIVKIGKLLWDTSDILGRSNNVVFRGQYNHNLGAPKICAIKCIVHSGVVSARNQCLEEIKRLEALQKCENVIEYYHHEESQEAFFLAMELADGGSLRYRIDKHILGDWNERKCLCRQLCEGLHHLHKMSIVHCDLKPDNLLLISSKLNREILQRKSKMHSRGSRGQHGGTMNTSNSNSSGVEWKLKIADFGLAKTINFSQSRITVTRAGVGTETWIPPEGFGRDADIQGQAKSSRTFSYDVHPCGSLLHYILSGGVHAFPGKNIRDMERNLRNGKCRSKIVFKERIDEGVYADMVEAMHLIGKMLELEPSDRPTMKAVLGHPFFMTATQKLNVIRRNRDNGWKWLQGKSFCDRYRGSTVDWRKFKKLRGLLQFMMRQNKYGKHLSELARFIRNAREHLYDSREDKETTSALAKAMGVPLLEHEDSVAADAKVVQYFSDTEPSTFLQLLPWPLAN